MERKVPMRLCTGCNEMKPKKELIRVIKSEEDVVSIDVTGKKNGRGAYICKSLECLEAACSNRGIERSLKMGIPKEIKENLLKELKEFVEE